MKNNKAQELIAFINKSPSVYHAVKNLADMLLQNGYTQLEQNTSFKLKPSGKYFILNNGSAIIAWQMPKSGNASGGFRIIGSHSDSPTFKIKPSPEIQVKNHFVKLNTEVYGGVILSTWFDRPLSIAGRIVIKTKQLLKPEIKLIDFEDPVVIIPNLAIHMNRDINDGYQYDKQKDVLPLFSINEDTSFQDGYLTKIIAEKYGIKPEDILDSDLFLYDKQPGCFTGFGGDFFSVGKIDNLGMAYPSIDALISSKPATDETSPFVQVAAVFDNEEVGSGTAQGAGSPFLQDTLQRIVENTCDGSPFEEFQKALASSFLISADQAHGYHPNYPEKNDITNFPLINKGPVIKMAASMSYTSDAVSAGIFKDICQRAGVPFQIFVNKSNMRGGSTIGPISVSNLNIKSVDIGNPILSMHSVRELGGTKDQEYITKVFTEFYK